jgi:polysaccharide export outer membrane protein
MKPLQLLMTTAVCLCLFACATTKSASVKDAKAAAAVVDAATVPTSQVTGNETAAKPDAAEAQKPTPITSDYFSKYLIGPGDVLAFRSFDDESLSTSVTVRYDGYVSLPLIPDIKLDGLTREDALAKIKEAYSSFYQEPTVSLMVTEPLSKKITVLGDVNQPADYFYTRPMTLLDAIAGAGGLRINQMPREGYIGAQGQLVKALVIRHANGEREVNEYDLRGLRQPGAHASDTPVLPGDIVYVPESVNLVYVLGAVRQPGVYPMTEGMTLLQLFSRAGSFDETVGRIKQIVIIRAQDDKTSNVLLVDARQILKTGVDMPLVVGDIIYVPRKPLANAQTFVSQLTGTVLPVLSLYRQAWDAYYTKDLYEETFHNDGDRAFDVLSIQQGLRSLGTFMGATLPLVP